MRWLARNDPYILAKKILGYSELTESFHVPLCHAFQARRYQKNLWMVPRGFFKTTILSIAANIQRILVSPDIRILLASNKAENAEAVLAEIKGLLTPGRSDAGEVLYWLFPEIFFRDPAKDADVWTTSRIAVKARLRRREPTITTVGLHGELTGRHYDHGTFDDLVGLENSRTRDERMNTIEWWKASQSLLDPGSTEDIVGTPWDWDDLYAYLLTQKQKHGMKLGVYKRACWEPHPEGYDTGQYGRVRATFPERFPVHDSEIKKNAEGQPLANQEALLTIKAAAGSTRFAAQYLLEPTDDETAVFQLKHKVVIARDRMPDPAGMWLVMTVDPAESKNKWADFTALVVAGFDHQGRMYVYHMDRGRWSETELIREMYAFANRYPGITVVGVESIAFQRYLLNLITYEGEQRKHYLPIKELKKETQKTKPERIRGLQPFWESGSIVLAEDLPVLDEFLDEAQKFRLYKESPHDDMLDALADCLQLRVRPHGPPSETPPADPELADELAAAQAIQEAREKAQRPRLSESDLARAVHHKRVLDDMDKDRDLVVAGAFDTFFH